MRDTGTSVFETTDIETNDFDARIAALGLELPPPMRLPPDVELPVPWVNVRGDRAFVSGHGPQRPDGFPAGPFGAVGGSISVNEAHDICQRTALSMLGSLRRELGSLNRITGWCRVIAMVSCSPRFPHATTVVNGFSDLIIEVFGPEVGRHARSVVGVASLPLDLAVGIEAEVMVSPA